MRTVLILSGLALGACSAQQLQTAERVGRTAERVAKVGCTAADLFLTVEPVAAAGCKLIEALPN